MPGNPWQPFRRIWAWNRWKSVAIKQGQVEEPGGGDVIVELEHGREVAPEQLTDAVGEPIAIVTQVLQQTRDLAQFDDTRIEWSQPPEAAQIGAQRIGEDERVAAVVLGAGGREAVAEAIELLRIDGVNTEATRHEGLDDRTVRRLDGDLDGVGLAPGEGEDPGRQGGETLATVVEAAFVQLAPRGIDDDGVVVLRGPVDADEPGSRSLIHGEAPAEVRAVAMLADPCTGARRRRLPTRHPPRPPAEARVPPQVLEAQGALGYSRQVGPIRSA